METKFYLIGQTAIPLMRKMPLLLVKAARSLFLLLVLLVAGFCGMSQTTPISFTQIPYSSPDIVSPGRGVEHWLSNANFDNSNSAQVPAGVTRAMDFYKRINWAQIELPGLVPGVYDWTTFDMFINDAIDHGQKYNFGVLPMAEQYGPYGSPGGATLSYPTYLHNQMQAEGANSQDWIGTSNSWVPNWNSNNYLTAWENLLNAIAAHIATGSHAGKNYRDVVGYIDIRGYGNFGEWHNSPWSESQPSGRVATSATLKRIIDSHIKAFPNYPLIALSNAYDGGNASSIPADVSYYALTATNNWGPFGWRRDNWGLDYLDQAYLRDNTGSFNGIAFAPLIMNKWKTARVVGEPNANSTWIPPYGDLPREMRLYHTNSFGNGNYGGISQQATKDSIIAASKACGYRLILQSGSMTSTLSGGAPFSISLNWQNIGIAPVYENWDVNFELRNSSNVAVWTGTSSFTPKLFLPAALATNVTDNFTLPASVKAGTYTMVMIIRDPLGYRQPLPLAINGRSADGSYPLQTLTLGVASNQPPVANAGPDQTITMPLDLVTLNGTGTDPDGTVKSYQWDKISGPSAGIIQTPLITVTIISGLLAGVYLYRLTVTDNVGASTSDTVKVTVNTLLPPANKAPVANAGSDISITLPVNTTTLNGSGSSDPDGTISTYAWSKISGPAQFSIASPAAATTSLNNLAQGVYSFALKVTDNSGASTSDTVKVTVNAAPPGNQPPVANAGGDIDLVLPTNSTTLNGSASTDPDGTIATYAWTKLTGPATFTIANPASATTALSNLVQGIYTFRLQVLDNGGATASDTITVTVDVAPPPANQPPVANAGTDITLTLPTNSTTLNGTGSTDPDGTIASYSWTKISGPAQYNIANAGASSTGLSNLVQGVYAFRLRVTDNSGARTSDTIKVTVNAAPNQPPVASAGTDITITLPTSSTTLNGSGSTDADGTISTYAWSRVSGPTQFTLGNAGAANTGLSNLVQGVYTFQLRVTDNSGASSTATVNVTVNAAPPAGNQPPIANAGSDITITLPTNFTLLNGSGSSDPDGTIATYAWTKVSGPAQFNIASPGSANTGLSNLVEGVYTFKLQVLDNGGATSSATVTVTVNAAPPASNQLPVADAGKDITITLPTNSTKLDGTGSKDPDGTIVSYSWNKISGPGAITIVNSNSVTPSVVGLLSGQYVFELTVTDNSGATAAARTRVLVNDPTNASPIADAGKDTTVALPVTSYLLDGSKSSDPDGSIVKYSWRQLSAPAGAPAAVIASPSSAISQLLNLTTEGDYVFELTVTDNGGSVSTATVKVTVTNNFRFTQSFKVYPNPTVSTLNIEYTDDNPGKIKVLVFDALGKLVINNDYTKAGTTLTQQINVDNLKAGAYFMQLIQENGQKLIRRFVKQ